MYRHLHETLRAFLVSLGQNDFVITDAHLSQLKEKRDVFRKLYKLAVLEELIDGGERYVEVLKNLQTVSKEIKPYTVQTPYLPKYSREINEIVKAIEADLSRYEFKAKVRAGDEEADLTISYLTDETIRPVVDAYKSYLSFEDILKNVAVELDEEDPNEILLADSVTTLDEIVAAGLVDVSSFDSKPLRKYVTNMKKRYEEFLARFLLFLLSSLSTSVAIV